jgi:hypothetical protein
VRPQNSFPHITPALRRGRAAKRRGRRLERLVGREREEALNRHEGHSTAFRFRTHSETSSFFVFPLTYLSGAQRPRSRALSEAKEPEPAKRGEGVAWSALLDASLSIPRDLDDCILYPPEPSCAVSIPLTYNAYKFFSGV